MFVAAGVRTAFSFVLCIWIRVSSAADQRVSVWIFTSDIQVYYVSSSRRCKYLHINVMSGDALDIAVVCVCVFITETVHVVCVLSLSSERWLLEPLSSLYCCHIVSFILLMSFLFFNLLYCWRVCVCIYDVGIFKSPGHHQYFISTTIHLKLI